MSELNPGELKRYSRHIIMPEVGLSGQRKLKDASVLVVGAGGLGSPAAYYLAAAGIGRLGIADFDQVDETNLHRQILHFASDVGRDKTESAAEKLHGINPFIEIVQHKARLSSENALKIFRDYDVIVDGTDNFATRYLVNDACVLLNKPNVYGSIFRFEGQVSVFWAAKGPCYRCLYPEPPPPGEVPSCAEAGVFGVLPGIVGSLQASEAIKLVLGIGEPLFGELLYFDSLATDFRKLHIDKNPNCPICGDNPTVHKLIDYEEFCGTKTLPGMEVDVQYLHKKLQNGEPFILLDVRERDEVEIAKIEQSVHIPMHSVASRLSELDKEKEILVMCHMGARSANITGLLRTQGFAKAKSVAGGIDAYAKEIDPSLATY